MVEKVLSDKAPESSKGEEIKKDARALPMIQQGVDDLFFKNSRATTTKQTWDILKV